MTGSNRILDADVLAGGYYLIDHRGTEGYEPGDNVVNIVAMGSPTTEAVKAAQRDEAERWEEQETTSLRGRTEETTVFAAFVDDE